MISQTPEDSPLKRWLGYLVIVVSVVLIAIYFASHREELELLGRIDPVATMTLTGLVLMNNILAGVKLFAILRSMGLKSISWLSWFGIFLISRFINLQVAQGANVYRIAILKRRYGFSYTNSLSMTAFFTWFETVLNLVLAGLCILLFSYSDEGWVESTQVFMLALAVGSGPWFVAALLVRWRVENGRLKWLHDKGKELTRGVTERLVDARLVLSFCSLTSASFVVYTTGVYVSFRAMGVEVSLAQTALFALVLLISRIVNVVPGNVGLSELLCGYLSTRMGASLGSGVLVSGLFRIVEYLLAGVLALGVVVVNKVLLPSRHRQREGTQVDKGERQDDGLIVSLRRRE